MKTNYKISARERWAIAFAPALLILAIYFFAIADDLQAGLDKQLKRMTAANGPIAAATASSSLAKATAARDTAKRDLEERETRIAQLEAKIAALAKPGGDPRPSASIIQRVEAVFRRNGIAAVTSGPADDADATPSFPAALLDAIDPKPTGDLANTRRDARVWHFIFDDQTSRFQAALKDLVAEIPDVVPLSMNLVYNPANSGKTRLLELWLVY